MCMNGLGWLLDSPSTTGSGRLVTHSKRVCLRQASPSTSNPGKIQLVNEKKARRFVYDLNFSRLNFFRTSSTISAMGKQTARDVRRILQEVPAENPTEFRKRMRGHFNPRACSSAAPRLTVMSALTEAVPAVAPRAKRSSAVAPPPAPLAGKRERRPPAMKVRSRGI